MILAKNYLLCLIITCMKIAIYSKYYKEDYKNILLQILNELLLYEDEVFLIDHLYLPVHQYINNKNIYVFKTHKDLNSSFDAMIVIGGDGTMLRAITYIRNLCIPILAINAGRLGFLATVSIDKISQTIQLLREKKYTLKRKNLLQTYIFNENNKRESLNGINFALNEITVSRKNTTSMIVVDAFLNDEFLNSYWADGLIISTPTGSTGYSLSCGGPIILPEVNSWVISPIAPHNLTVRPLIIPDETNIRLKVSSREENFLISLDSRTKSIPCKYEIEIQKADFQIYTISFPEDSFLKTIRQKLLWGEDKRLQENKN